MDKTINMAREAGLHRQQHNLMSNPVQIRYSYDGYEEQLKAFEALVRADEREELLQNSVQAHEVDAFRDVVTCNTIRARGNT